MRYLLAIAALLASSAYGETTVGQLEPAGGTWRVYRGSTYVCTANSEAAALACAAANAETRRTTTRYQIRYPNRYVTVTYVAPAPVCGPKPADLTQDGTCPTGTAGSWQQVKTHISAPYPQCWTQSEWTPATPPAGTCQPIPPPDADGDGVPDAQDQCPSQPAATPDGCPVVEPPSGSIANLPVVCSATVAEGAAISACAWASQSFRPASASSMVRSCATTSCTNSTATWRRLSNAVNVEVCTAPKLAGDPIVGGSCGTAWSAMAYVPVSQVVTEPAPVAWTFCANEWELCEFEGTRRVRYGAGSSWVEREVAAVNGGVACRNSVFGDPIEGTVKRCELSGTVSPGPDPEPDPAPGTATIAWTAPTQNTDGSALTDLAGFRIHYGPSATMLHQVIDVPNPGIRSFVVNGLEVGTHYFAVRAYTPTNESALSNITSKTVR